MKSAVELRELLNRIDHKGYPAYKDTRGVYQFEGYLLGIDHVQGDPFAAPSKVSIRVKGRQAGFPKHLFDVNIRELRFRIICSGSFLDRWRNLHLRQRDRERAVFCQSADALRRS